MNLIATAAAVDAAKGKVDAMKNLCGSRTSVLTIKTLLLFLCAATSVSAQPRRIDLSDLALEANLSDPQISPDGSKIVLIASRPDYEENRFENELALVDLATGSKRLLTYARPGVRHPRWSPSGDRVAFLANDTNKKSQIFVLPLGGGEAKRVTEAERGVNQFSWRPDGKELAFVTEDEPEEKTGEEKHNQSFEVGDNVYLATEATMASHAWIVSPEFVEPKRLTSGAEGLSVYFGPAIDWSPDGKTLALATQPRPQSGEALNRSIKILDPATGQYRVVVAGPTTVGPPSFSPDGRNLAYSGPNGPEPYFNPDDIFVVPVAGGESRNVTPKIDRDLTGFWMPDSRSLLLAGNDQTRVSLWIQPLDGEPKQLKLGGVIPSMPVSVGVNGALAFIGTEPQRPEELYYMPSTDGTPRRLTSFNEELSSRDLGQVETIVWDGPDGFEENGVLIYPPDFDPAKKYPLVLSIHGGPMSTSTESFSAFRQILAAQGWVVFSPNYRGSNNMGRVFQRAVINDAGDGPGRDVMAGIAAVKARGFTDENRIAVSGWSYGGYMTSWMIAHYPGWKAAVAGAAVTDWFDWYNLADMNVWSGYGLGGSPWLNDNTQAYWEQSPIKYAPSIRTPTLILSNTGDPRVTVTQSYKLYHALKDNGVSVQFIAYPIPGHFPQDPVHQRDVYRRWMDWIRRHFEAS
jgi:dipeptidyl aminopeptidase/acylaminoacyl peptidase